MVWSAAIVAGGGAGAHGLGMSQLRLRLDGARAEGEWEIQLRDARRALGLDPGARGLKGDGDGWRDVRDRETALRAYLASRIAISADGAACPVALAPGAPRWQGEPAQAVVLRVSARCPAEPVRLEIRCDLLFDLDPAHRAYFSVEDARVTHAGLFRADRRSVTLDVHRYRPAQIAAELVRDGVVHIWSGLDHLLFLIALLLAAPLVRRGGQWLPRPGLGAAAREAIKIVTAFTLAHSLTLALSFVGFLLLPARWVEAAIALSVFAAAWNNLRPFVPGRAWVMAFAFGLVHGLGFAGALRNLALPLRARGLALAAFNVGVELGQLAILAAVLPLLYYGSRRPWYPRMVVGVGSLAVAWLALLWTLERGFGLSIVPRFF